MCSNFCSVFFSRSWRIYVPRRFCGALFAKVPNRHTLFIFLRVLSWDFECRLRYTTIGFCRVRCGCAMISLRCVLYGCTAIGLWCVLCGCSTMCLRCVLCGNTAICLSVFFAGEPQWVCGVLLAVYHDFCVLHPLRVYRDLFVLCPLRLYHHLFVVGTSLSLKWLSLRGLRWVYYDPFVVCSCSEA